MSVANLDEARRKKLLAIAESREYLLASELAEYWGITPQRLNSYLNDFKTELNRNDSKIPQGNYVEHSQKLKWYNKYAFQYFMIQKINLEDKVRRKKINKYSRNELKKLQEE